MYPYEYVDDASTNDFYLEQSYPPYRIDHTESNVYFENGTLKVPLVVFEAAENTQSSVYFENGTLKLPLITYTAFDQIQSGALIFEAGTLRIVLINYTNWLSNISAESTVSSLSFENGTLL